MKNSFFGVILLGFLGIVFLIALRYFYPIGIDWEASYYRGVRHFRTPYEDSSFTGLPWLLFFVPHAFLSLAWGNAINLFLNVAVPLVVIQRFKGGWQALLIVFTSPVFLDLARTNNVDWVPLCAFLLPPMWGLPFLAAKPQTIGGAGLIWWKRQHYGLKMLIPMVVVVGIAVVIWQTQPLDAISVGGLSNVDWNFAPWPFMIPAGLYLLYKGLRHDDDILAAAATPFLVPYFAPYSLVPLLVLLACKYRREALYLNLGFWMYLIVESRRLAGG